MYFYVRSLLVSYRVFLIVYIWHYCFVYRFAGLRQILDAEMKDVHREGVKNLKEQKQGFTVEDEEAMWQKGVLGNITAKTGYYHSLHEYAQF